MKKAYFKTFPHLYTIIFILTISFMVTSCGSTRKNVIYFENLKRDTTLTNLVTNDFELKIQKGDILNIIIISKADANTPLNSQYNAPGAASGYLVDNNGYIEFFQLGKIKVEGLTRDQLKEYLKNKLEPDYLKGVIITVRFTNHKVTVLGEVGTPHTLAMPNDQMTLLDALALSGDLTATGRRDNILVIRDKGIDKDFKRINLNDNSVFSSPYYYLRPDDIIYVEPIKAKLKNPGQLQQTASLIISGISIILIVLTQVFKL